MFTPTYVCHHACYASMHVCFHTVPDREDTAPTFNKSQVTALQVHGTRFSTTAWAVETKGEPVPRG